MRIPVSLLSALQSLYAGVQYFLQDKHKFARVKSMYSKLYLFLHAQIILMGRLAVALLNLRPVLVSLVPSGTHAFCEQASSCTY